MDYTALEASLRSYPPDQGFERALNVIRRQGDMIDILARTVQDIATTDTLKKAVEMYITQDREDF